MQSQGQQLDLFASIGGDPLEGSGFETEIPVFEDEPAFDSRVEEQETESP